MLERLTFDLSYLSAATSITGHSLPSQTFVIFAPRQETALVNAVCGCARAFVRMRAGTCECTVQWQASMRGRGLESLCASMMLKCTVDRGRHYGSSVAGACEGQGGEREKEGGKGGNELEIQTNSEQRRGREDALAPSPAIILTPTLESARRHFGRAAHRRQSFSGVRAA